MIDSNKGKILLCKNKCYTKSAGIVFFIPINNEEANVSFYFKLWSYELMFEFNMFNWLFFFESWLNLAKSISRFVYDLIWFLRFWITAFGLFRFIGRGSQNTPRKQTIVDSRIDTLNQLRLELITTARAGLDPTTSVLTSDYSSNYLSFGK